MTHPTIISSRVIGTFAGEPMHAWIEVDAAGTVRFFEDYATTVFSPALGRDIGLTMVRETTGGYAPDNCPLCHGAGVMFNTPCMFECDYYAAASAA